MNNHPNATASFITTGLAAVLVHFTNHYHWTGLTPEDALIAAGGLITVVLFIGRKGIGPTLKGIWHGASSTVSGSNTPPKP